MKPALQALKDALKAWDVLPPTSRAGEAAHKALHTAAVAAGFTPQRAVVDWARYQVAVGEAAEQLAEPEEPDAETRELFA